MAIQYLIMLVWTFFFWFMEIQLSRKSVSFSFSSPLTDTPSWLDSALCRSIPLPCQLLSVSLHAINHSYRLTINRRFFFYFKQPLIQRPKLQQLHAAFLWTTFVQKYQHLGCEHYFTVLINNEDLDFTRWFKYDRDKLWLVYTQSVPVIFEPPCTWDICGSYIFCSAWCHDLSKPSKHIWTRRRPWTVDRSRLFPFQDSQTDSWTRRKSCSMHSVGFCSRG